MTRRLCTEDKGVGDQLQGACAIMGEDDTVFLVTGVEMTKYSRDIFKKKK